MFFNWFIIRTASHTADFSEALWTLSLRSGQDVILETTVSPAVMKESTPEVRSHFKCPL